MGLSYLLELIFLLIVGIQVYFYFFLFRKLALYSSATSDVNTFPISILICAKNEAANLNKFLPHILSQNYPKFEIILINDRSQDETLEIMESFKRKDSRIKIVDVQPNERFHGNKKYALTLGIRAASYEFLLLTDADCRPRSNLWIAEMASRFSLSTKIVLGYGSYRKIERSFLNKLIRFETLLAATQYLSMALVKSPYMGVGRNLAYKKGLFIENNGFSNHIKIKSGDDDLLIGKISSSSNTTISINKESFTISEPKTDLLSWINQKRRHITTSTYYRLKHKIILGLFYVSQLFFYLFAILLLLKNDNLLVICSAIILRFIVVFAILKSISKKLDERDLLPYIPFLELLLIIFQFYIFIFNLISPPKHWN